jgi:hypothetical protein
MRSSPNLVSLCGIADDATEADLSGLNMDADDAIILATELPDKGAISSMNLLQNHIGTDQAKTLASILKGHPTLKSLCGNMGDETELDMSGKEMGADDAIMLAAEIVGNGALTSLNLASNNLEELILPVGWEKKSVDNDGRAPWVYEHTDGTKQDYNPGKPEGAIALANAIPNMRALSVLSLKKNYLGTKEVAKVLGEMLKENSVLKELDLSDNRYYSGGWKTDPEFAEELAAGIKDNGALSSFTFSGNYSSSKPVTMETTMTKADCSGKALGVSGGMMVAAFLPKCQ